MKFDIDFSPLKNLANQLNIVVNEHDLIDLMTQEDHQRLSMGIEIDASLIDWTQNLFIQNDQVVFLHIKDNRSTRITDLNFPRKLKRYHFWNCSTLKEMVSKGKEDKYVFSKSSSPVFLVDVKNKNNDRRRLQACLNCIHQSGIKRTISEKYPSHEQILKFMKDKEIEIKKNARSQYLASTGYTQNWSDISFKLRKNRNWTCSSCKVSLTERYSFCLDVHHINGNKADNRIENLSVLCKICHSEQPNHEHMKLEKGWDRHKNIIITKRRNNSTHEEI